MTADVINQAQIALAESPIHALHDLHVDSDGERLVLSGRVDSFYHKQLAQEIIRLVAGDMHVVNSIKVEY